MYKTSSKVIFFAIFAFIAMLIGIMIWVSDDGQEDKKGDSSEINSSVVDNSENKEVENQNNEFEEITYNVQNALIGRMGYGKDLKESGIQEREEYQLQPVYKEGTENEQITIKTGHNLYKSATNGNMYIVSGETPVAYVDGKIKTSKYLREEKTNKRIRTFNNQAELDDFKERWKAGQRILKYETTAEKGSVIIDGCLTDIKFEQKNNDVYFNILDAMKVIVPDSYYTKGDGFLNVFLNGMSVEKLPTSSIPRYYEKYDVSPISDTYKFTGVNNEKKPFTYRAKLIDERDMLVCGKDIHVILGWKFYSNGNVLSIITSPENVTDEGVVYIFNENSGYEVRIENNGDGTYSKNTYDSHGNLIDSVQYDIPNDENIMNEPLENTENQSENNTANSSENNEEDDDIVV